VGAAAAKKFGGRCQARLGEAFVGNAGATERKPLRHTTADTTPRPNDRGLVSARTSGELRIERRKIAFPSSRVSICPRRDRPIRKKNYRTQHRRFSGQFLREWRLRESAAGVPAAPSASAPAWPRNFPPSTSQAARRSPCGDWRHG